MNERITDTGLNCYGSNADDEDKRTARICKLIVDGEKLTAVRKDFINRLYMMPYRTRIKWTLQILE